ncbi:MAG: hypothetical protein FWG89_10215 [Treponema sp.]|nr:hypothetical protein [Treponema sp.]
MASLKSGFPLQNGEQFVLEIESKLYMTSSFFIFRFFWGAVRPFLQILGFGRRGFLIVTDRRFIEMHVQKIFWFIRFRRNVTSIPIKKVSGTVECVKKGRFLFFARAYQVCYQRPFFCRVYYVLPGKEAEEVYKITNLLTETIASSR